MGENISSTALRVVLGHHTLEIRADEQIVAVAVAMAMAVAVAVAAAAAVAAAVAMAVPAQQRRAQVKQNPTNTCITLDNMADLL